MTDHPSNPDQLMARALGVCWHSPTSDRWPCPATADPATRVADDLTAEITDHSYRPDRQGQWHTDRCDLCGEPRTAHRMTAAPCNAKVRAA